MSVIRAGCASLAGSKHGHNEDAVGIDDHAAILVDGISGTSHGRGRLMARAAVLGWRERPAHQTLAEIVHSIDRVLVAIGDAEGIGYGGACSCLAEWDERRSRIELANVGDTTALVVRDDGVERLFEPGRDRSLRLTKYLGSGRNWGRNVDRRALSTDEVRFVVLLSDGVWEHVGQGEVGELCFEYGGDPEAAAFAIVTAARNGGGMDDASAVVLDIRNERHLDQMEGV